MTDLPDSCSSQLVAVQVAKRTPNPIFTREQLDSYERWSLYEIILISYCYNRYPYSSDHRGTSYEASIDIFLAWVRRRSVRHCVVWEFCDTFCTVSYIEGITSLQYIMAMIDGRSFRDR